MSEVNTDLESGHFQHYGLVQPGLDFQRVLEIECLENTIGVKLGDNGRPKRSCKIPICVPCDKMTVKHHGGMWDTSKKNRNKNIKSNAIRTIQDAVKIPGTIVIVPRVYYCAQ